MRFFLIYALTACLSFISINTVGQENYGLVIPTENRGESVCQEFSKVLRSLPYDASPNVTVIDGRIVIYFRGFEYFNRLFSKGSDGIAVDIVHRDQFSCGNYDPEIDKGLSRGRLLKPMFRNALIKNKTERKDGYVMIDYGPLPMDVDVNSTELNLLLVNQKFRCSYIAAVHAEYNNWSLLETGLYRDAADTSLINSASAISKTLEFIIPFEKNMAQYDATSIRPLYDSLNLTDYNIVEMDIRAYTSVEGSLERNIELQEQRAKSIVAALQEYQNPEIISNVSASENWVEFLDDIQLTPHEYMERLSKKEIKEKLTGDVLSELEPTLAGHRKARIVLKLQKKFSATENDPELLKKFFDQSIEGNNLDQALYLQDIAFEKVLTRILPQEFIGELEIPHEAKYGPLLNNRLIFRNEIGDEDLYETIKRFEDLQALLPGNAKIRYNILALQLRAWREGELLADAVTLRSGIKSLKNSEIEQELVDRLWVNYFLILTDYHYQRQQQQAVHQDLKQVMFYYDEDNRSDEDLLSITKFLCAYGEFGWSVDMLDERVLELEADEDLIFFFISLTIFRTEWTGQPIYRTLMMNALDKNPDRFCALFLPKSLGGVSFQILEDEYLRFTYCESCQYVVSP